MYTYFDFDYNSAVFEWDDAKAKINYTKHGVRFETAAKAFSDQNKLIREDEEHPEEERYNVLAKIGKVLFIVCVFKSQNTVRIISARKANKMEERRYRYGESYDDWIIS
jgi:uncharacterized DUF497 family protein